MKFPATITLFFGLLAAGIAAWPSAVPAQSSTVADKNVEAIALQWFEKMRTGHIDRTQLAPVHRVTARWGNKLGRIRSVAQTGL
jgi:hypothetical protein